MKMIGLVVLGVTLVIAAFGVSLIATAWPRSVPGGTTDDARQQRRRQASGVLRDVLDDSKQRKLSAAAQLESYVRACEKAVAILGTDSQATAALADAARAAVKSTAAANDVLPSLHATMERIGGDLAFSPIIEAELPRDFPPPTPVGEIEVKHYPSYRMARTDAGGSAFWTLFRHIKREKIAMTAPVQMDYQDSARKLPAQRWMAFLYQSPELGDVGTEGAVRVDDVAPTTVISIGLRGDRTRESLMSARQRLTDWLEANSSRFERSGEIRVMGYNSPFVPASRRYHEVQIPVVAKRAAEKDDSRRSPLDLSDYVWQSRVVLAFAPTQDDAASATLLESWHRQMDGVSDRDLVLVEVFEQGESRVGSKPLAAADASTLRERFAAPSGRSTFILIGKDGGEKLRRTSIDLSQVFSVIDAMPMRQAEMARKRAG